MTRPTLATSTLRFVTLEEAEDMMRRGSITQDQYEGYMHAWTTSAPRFADYPAWKAHQFTTREAEAVALELGCCAYKGAGLVVTQ